jgi:hypothetical protein
VELCGVALCRVLCVRPSLVYVRLRFIGCAMNMVRGVCNICFMWYIEISRMDLGNLIETALAHPL